MVVPLKSCVLFEKLFFRIEFFKVGIFAAKKNSGGTGVKLRKKRG